MYDTILIDFFGVIDSSLYDSWLGRHGYTRSGEFADISDSTDSGQMTMQQFFDQLGELSGIPSEEIKKDFKAHESINVELLQLLKKLRANYKIVLVSNASGSYLRDILKRYNLEPIFTEVIISGEIGIIKPSPEIFEYALDKVGSITKKSIFIDDRMPNVKAAEELGIKSIEYKGVVSLKQILSGLGVE